MDYDNINRLVLKAVHTYMALTPVFGPHKDNLGYAGQYCHMHRFINNVNPTMTITYTAHTCYTHTTPNIMRPDFTHAAIFPC